MIVEAMEDQAAGMGPHRPGFPERLSEVRVLSVDQLAGIVDTSPSELRSSDARVERLDQEAGRVPPKDGDLGCAISESSEMGNSGQCGEAGSSHLYCTHCKTYHGDAAVGNISQANGYK